MLHRFNQPRGDNNSEQSDDNNKHQTNIVLNKEENSSHLYVKEKTSGGKKRKFLRDIVTKNQLLLKEREERTEHLKKFKHHVAQKNQEIKSLCKKVDALQTKDAMSSKVMDTQYKMILALQEGNAFKKTIIERQDKILNNQEKILRSQSLFTQKRANVLSPAPNRGALKKEEITSKKQYIYREEPTEFFGRDNQLRQKEVTEPEQEAQDEVILNALSKMDEDPSPHPVIPCCAIL